MNVLIIPSWYPSPQHPSTGIFFKEQALALARNHPDLNVGISTWGSHDEHYWLRLKEWYLFPSKMRHFRCEVSTKTKLSDNCSEYCTPALTWSRKIWRGNIKKIIQANEENLQHFQEEYGPVDLIHAHVAYPGGYIAMKLARKYDAPFIITEHMSPFPFKTFLNHGHLSNAVANPLLKSNANIAVSHALQTKMKHFHIASRVIPNLVDEHFFSPGDAPRKAYELLSVGRLESQKGYEYLLDAFAMLVSSFPKATLNIIGAGSLHQYLLSRVHQLRLQDKVKFVGEQNRDHVRDAMRSCDLFVLPSLHENLPLVLLEAIACGTPIVSTDCRGPEDIVNAINGKLAKTADASDLHYKLLELLKHRQTYQAQAIREDFEQRFSSRVVTSQIVSTYHSVLS